MSRLRRLQIAGILFKFLRHCNKVSALAIVILHWVISFIVRVLYCIRSVYLDYLSFNPGDSRFFFFHLSCSTGCKALSLFWSPLHIDSLAFKKLSPLHCLCILEQADETDVLLWPSLCQLCSYIWLASSCSALLCQPNNSKYPLQIQCLYDASPIWRFSRDCRIKLAWYRLCYSFSNTCTILAHWPY